VIGDHIYAKATEELKTEPFNHESMGQLNTYLNWYADNEQIEGDNPSVGILLLLNFIQLIIVAAKNRSIVMTALVLGLPINALTVLRGFKP